jgi:hypothetical protein
MSRLSVATLEDQGTPFGMEFLRWDVEKQNIKDDLLDGRLRSNPSILEGLVDSAARQSSISVTLADR